MSSYKFGLYLRQLIKDKGISIAEFSRRTSLSRECIYKLIRGDVRQPDLTTIVILAKALHTHPLQLLRRLFDGGEFRKSVSPSPSETDDAVGFVADVTYPDNSMVYLNEKFTKVWEIQNTGRQMWRNRRLICMDNQLEVRVVLSNQTTAFHALSNHRCLIPAQREVVVPNACPGESIQLSVEFKAPSFPCSTISYWKMVDESGAFCFPKNEGLSCLVQVVAL